MTARAVLFSGDPETGEVSMDVFSADDEPVGHWMDGRPMDPFHRAEGIRLSCESDFPNRVWAIHLNEEARVLMGNERMRQMARAGAQAPAQSDLLDLIESVVEMPNESEGEVT